MLAPKVLFGLVFSLISPVSSDEDFYQVKACCIYKGPHFNDTEYILIPSFNKHDMMEYNSTRGYWIGFPPYAKWISHIFNNGFYNKRNRKNEQNLLCDEAVHIIENLAYFTTAPTIKMRSVIASDGEHPAMLMCSAYNFYPKQIQLTWLRNGQEVSEGVSYSDVMDDGDLRYQIYSHLEYTPVSEEIITCRVEHISLSEPRLINLDGPLSVRKNIQIAVGVCGLLLGLIIVSSGFLYYKKISAVYNTVDQGQADNVTNFPEDGAL